MAVQVVQVAGVPHANRIHISGTYLSGQATVGWVGELLLGFPGYKAFSPIPGLNSEQRFGIPSGRGGPIGFPVGVAVGSAQQFGTPFVYSAWVHPGSCQPVTLTPLACVDVTLVPSVEM
jgi:hypothetical protein